MVAGVLSATIEHLGLCLHGCRIGDADCHRSWTRMVVLRHGRHCKVVEDAKPKHLESLVGKQSRSRHGCHSVLSSDGILGHIWPECVPGDDGPPDSTCWGRHVLQPHRCVGHALAGGTVLRLKIGARVKFNRCRNGGSIKFLPQTPFVFTSNSDHKRTRMICPMYRRTMSMG